jgi:hypothetical protein
MLASIERHGAIAIRTTAPDAPIIARACMRVRETPRPLFDGKLAVPTKRSALPDHRRDGAPNFAPPRCSSRSLIALQIERFQGIVPVLSRCR